MFQSYNAKYSLKEIASNSNYLENSILHFLVKYFTILGHVSG